MALILQSSGPSVSPLAAWSPEPSVIVIVLAISALYVVGWRRARASGSSHAPGYGRLALFALGMLCVVAALISPVDELGEQLLVMHMAQHLLLLDLAPICVILSFNKVLLRPISRRITVIERKAGFFASPVFAVLAYAGVMYVWHWPAAYDAALHDTTRPRLRAHLLHAGRLAVLVARALPDPRPPAPDRAGADRLHDLDQAAGGRAGHRARLLDVVAVPVLHPHAALLGGSRRSRIRTWPAC